MPMVAVPSAQSKKFLESAGEDGAERHPVDIGPWRFIEHMPAVSIGATHSIAGVGPKVGEWPLIPGHMGLHHWEYVTRSR